MIDACARPWHPYGVKLRRVPALLSAAWFLMLPLRSRPSSGDLLGNFSTPISDWKVFGIYESATTCAEVKDQLQQSLMDQGIVPSQALAAREHARCVAAGDPLLKGKWDWYLVNPPFSQWLHHQGVAGYDEAPLRDWQKLQVFNTKDECEQMVRALRRTFDRNPKDPIRNRAQYDSRLAVCVARNDPRLERK